MKSSCGAAIEVAIKQKIAIIARLFFIEKKVCDFFMNIFFFFNYYFNYVFKRLFDIKFP
jgi:hypothetical protein